MKKLIIMTYFFVYLLFPPSVWGAPASPFPVVYEQPDGTTVEIFRRGDEFFNWAETSDAFALAKNESTGFWEYALLSNNRLVPSGFPYRPGLIPPGRTPKNYRPSPEILETVRSKRSGRSYSPINNKAVWEPRHISGERKVLAIRVGFSNQSLTIAESNTKSAFFADTNSVKRYYADQSRGALQIASALGGTTVLTVNLSAGDANGGNHPDGFIDSGNIISEHQNEVAFLKSVLAKAADAGVNFASFDTNNDGNITPDELCVYLIVAGYEESGSASTPSVWAHAWGSWTGWGIEHEVTIAGKVLTKWAMNGEMLDGNVAMPFGVICHELGHQFCKLPDLYDTAGYNQGLGHFSLMAGGSWGRLPGAVAGSTPVNLDAWSRQFLGWETPQTPTSGQVSLGTPFNGNRAAVRLASASHRSTEYYLAEVRALSGWDAGLGGLYGFNGVSWSGAGILILHVDETVGSGSLDVGNDFNRYVSGQHQGCMAVEANGVHMARTDGLATRGSPGTLWYSGNPNYIGNGTFTGTSSPNSNFYDGTSSGIAVTNISAGGQVMSFSLPSSSSSSITDFNGDGKADLVWQERMSNRLSVWYMNGARKIGGQSLNPSSIAGNWRIVAVQDMNGDGRPDLVWQEMTSNRLSVWYMNGARKIGGQSLNPSSVPGNWRIAHSGAWSDLGAGGSSLSASLDSASGESAGGCSTASSAPIAWILLLFPFLMMKKR